MVATRWSRWDHKKNHAIERSKRCCVPSSSVPPFALTMSPCWRTELRFARTVRPWTPTLCRELQFNLQELYYVCFSTQHHCRILPQRRRLVFVRAWRRVNLAQTIFASLQLTMSHAFHCFTRFACSTHGIEDPVMRASSSYKTISCLVSLEKYTCEKQKCDHGVISYGWIADSAMRHKERRVRKKLARRNNCSIHKKTSPVSYFSGKER